MLSHVVPADGSREARFTALWLNGIGLDEHYQQYKAGRWASQNITNWEIRERHVARGLVKWLVPPERKRVAHESVGVGTGDRSGAGSAQAAADSIA